MCDLTGPEKDALLVQISQLDDLVTQIRASARSIEERNWMDHDELTRLLAGTAETATNAQQWVHQKMAATHTG